jgi:hypothetical protein
LRARGFRRHDAEPNVGHRDIDIPVIDGDAPLDAADLAASANPFLPDNLSAAIRIKRNDEPRFLSGDQDAFAVGKIGKHSR